MIDLDKARDEERFDGMWVLRTNTDLAAVEIALRYKQLWMVEQLFRTARSLLDTRPIFHKTDATICGHVFCSFLSRRTLACRAKVFPVSYNSLTSNMFHFSTVEDGSKVRNGLARQFCVMWQNRLTALQAVICLRIDVLEPRVPVGV